MLKVLLSAGNTAGTRYTGEELEDLVGKKVGDEGVYLSLDILTSFRCNQHTVYIGLKIDRSGCLIWFLLELLF